MRTKFLIAAFAISFAASAVADPIPLSEIDDGEVYKLGNHPDGSIRDPLYGLRLDGLLGDASQEYTFNFEMMGAHMTMVKSGAELKISGTAWGGEDIGSTYDAAEMWTIDFTYTDLGTAGCGPWCAISGIGTIASASYGSFDLVSKSSSAGFAFKLGDHRGTETSGWGWLNHCPSDGNDEDGMDCERHYAASDWLFTVHQKVPEPTTLVLFGLGLAGMGLMSRRRKIT